MSDDVPETDQSEEKLIAPLRHELLHPIEDMQDENDRQFITALARGLSYCVASVQNISIWEIRNCRK